MDSMRISIRRSIAVGFSIALVFFCGTFIGVLHEKGLLIIGIGIIIGTAFGIFIHINDKLKEVKQRKMDSTTMEIDNN